MRNWKLAAAVVVTQFLGAAAYACPMCKDSIPGAAGPGGDMTGGAGGSLPSGFNTSVYLMLLSFLASLGLICFQVTKGIRATNATMRAGVTPRRPG